MAMAQHSTRGTIFRQGALNGRPGGDQRSSMQVAGNLGKFARKNPCVAWIGLS